MRLDLYFARRFLMTFLGLFVVFTFIYALLDMVEQIRKFDTDSIGFLGVLHLTALNIPAGLYSILPLIVILSTIALFLGLARSSELVVARSAGRSALRSLLAPAFVAFVIGLISVAVFNPIVAATSKQYESTSSHYKTGNASVFSISRDGLWLRQGNESGQTVVRAQRSNLDGTELFGVTFLGFGTDGMMSYRIEAESTELMQGEWVARNAKYWAFENTENPEKDSEFREEIRIASDLTQEQIRDSFGTPSSISIWDLPGFINNLELAGFSARKHRVWLQMELALPVMLTAMVLIGAGFTMRHTRFGRTGLMVMLAVLSGFGIFFIRNFAQILGENGQIPILISAWATPVAAIMMTLGLLLHLEDG